MSPIPAYADADMLHMPIFLIGWFEKTNRSARGINRAGYDGSRYGFLFPVTAAAMELMIAADVGILHPVHPAAEVAIVVRPNGQVKMVGHQAIGENPHRDFNAGMAHRLEKRLVVPVLEKNLAAAVAAIDDVVTNSANRGSRDAWHEVAG